MGKGNMRRCGSHVGGLCVFSEVDGDGVVIHEKVKDLQYLNWIQIYH